MPKLTLNKDDLESLIREKYKVPKETPFDWNEDELTICFDISVEKVLSSVPLKTVELTPEQEKIILEESKIKKPELVMRPGERVMGGTF